MQSAATDKLLNPPHCGGKLHEKSDSCSAKRCLRSLSRQILSIAMKILEGDTIFIGKSDRLLGLHDPAAGGALRDRPFSARRFGGPFFGGGHSAASAFLSHGYGILDGFLTFNCGRDDLPPGGVLLWGLTLLRGAPARMFHTAAAATKPKPFYRR